jgi:hypothetical protein
MMNMKTQIITVFLFGAHDNEYDEDDSLSVLDLFRIDAWTRPRGNKRLTTPKEEINMPPTWFEDANIAEGFRDAVNWAMGADELPPSLLLPELSLSPLGDNMICFAIELALR